MVASTTASTVGVPVTQLINRATTLADLDAAERRVLAEKPLHFACRLASSRTPAAWSWTPPTSQRPTLLRGLRSFFGHVERGESGAGQPDDGSASFWSQYRSSQPRSACIGAVAAGTAPIGLTRHPLLVA